MIRITGGRVFTPVGMIDGDVWVEGDTVVAVGSEGRLSADKVIDATGMLVGPGFVDLHVHLREPGQTWKEDIDSGTRAAAAGGYTAIVAMPNTDPAIDSVEMVEMVADRGAIAGNCHVASAASITKARSGAETVDFENLHAVGVRMFTDDGDSVMDRAILFAAMERVAALDGAFIAQHAEERTISGGGHLSPGPLAESSGLRPIPSEAEWAVIARDLEAAEYSESHYHAQHLSTAEAVDLIRVAKARGVRVTSEVTPHHLSFDSISRLDTNLKMYPPIRSAEDREALIAGLRDGTIDAVATDHAPHSLAEKSVSFEDAPRGVIGLETAAAVVWEILRDPALLFSVMSVNPARIAGLDRHGIAVGPGSPANLVVFDPNDKWIVTGFRSRSANSPYLGETLQGRPKVTIYEGVVTNEMERVR